MTAKDILVLGSTGKTGSRVAQRLRTNKLPLRLGTRAGSPPFDWADRATWGHALDGVASVYVSYYPDLAAPGAPQDIQAFTDLAVQSKVKRLVLLSGRGEPEARVCEHIVRHSGLEWTLLRASWFAQNFSEGAFLEPILAGEVALPVGNMGEPFVDAEDIADVALAALTQDHHVGQVYELTGPRLWTFEQAIAEIAHAAGREIGFTQITLQKYTAALREAHLAPEAVSLIQYLFEEVLDGRNSTVQDGVIRAIGRPARDFSDYVRVAATSGVWNTNV